MKGSNTVAGLELDNIITDTLDYAGDIISLVTFYACPLGHLPVLGIAPADHHFDQDLVRPGLRGGRVDDPDLDPYSKEVSAQALPSSRLSAPMWAFLPLAMRASFILASSCSSQSN